jgi:hypothetical protein
MKNAFEVGRENHVNSKYGKDWCKIIAALQNGTTKMNTHAPPTKMQLC